MSAFPPARERRAPGRHQGSGFHLAMYLVSGVYALIILLPVYYLLISSFKSNPEIFGNALALPASLDFTKYLDALRFARLTDAMWVSLQVVVGTEVLVLVLAFPASYAVARLRTRLAPVVEAVFGLGFLVPTFALLLPVFLFMARTGLLFKPISLILFYTATRLPLSVIFLASFMRQIPRELEESAQIDGASRLQTLVHVFIPLTAPGTVTLLILNFIFVWNEFLFSLILLRSENRTIQVAIASLRGELVVDYGLLAAGVVVSVIPVFIVFVFFQERIAEGLSAGSLKG